MDKIRFNAKAYDLKDAVNATATRFQASIIKGTATVDEIAADATNVDEIYILDGVTGATKAIYKGYTKPVAFYLIDDYVSVELDNTDILDLINRVDAKTDANTQSISSINTSLNSVNGEIANLNETQLSQDAAIEDLASAL